MGTPWSDGGRAPARKPIDWRPVARRAALAASVVLLVFVAVVVRYRLMIDPRTLLHERMIGAMADAVLTGRVAPRGALARFHRGEPPCLRYEQPPPATSEQVELAGQSLAAAGLTAHAAEVGTLAQALATDDELQRHGPRGAQETCEWLRLGGEPAWRAWIVAHLNAERLDEAEHAQAAEALAAAQEALEPALAARARDLWRNHREALAPPSFVRVRQGLDPLRTWDRLQRLAEAWRHFRDARRRSPASLAELDSYAPGLLLVDEWFWPVQLEWTPDAARLVSLGRDHKPGGEGDDRDVVMAVSK